MSAKQTLNIRRLSSTVSCSGLSASTHSIGICKDYSTVAANMHALQTRPTHIAYSQATRAAATSRKTLHIVAKASKGSSAKPASKQVSYGTDWYEQTRNAVEPARTVREEIAYRKEANRLANNGKERKDLYTANWDGAEYKGSKFNILTVIALVSVLTPLLGLVFAYTTFGVLWG